ncbi:DEAD/DEAH box helicase [Albimonas sp. CAU 1670]|uniref:DEAD/DEAH box helicase n=1 Tax=Albimonas sp. CAU 1670 TaxID=3032599 RepID=UPI0023DBC67E|nr:DEAD/DEAH box helicase [Albimonas sp. CAU 1670]MDF2231885.1 DEAD/DEAH box helicase [Albimonas sp. CAU 1670]
MKFSDLDLDPKVLQAVEEAGYETPTPIQEQAIPHALMGRDVLGIAQTGTGKTASFTLPMISILAQGRAKARMPRSLILCPTRELAAQVAENFETYGKYHKLTMALLIGGVSFKDQDKLIDRGVDVLIATPGRLLDHFERGKLMLTGVQVMVVDEADRMLDMGFIPDLERIFGLLPFTKQTLFFSATMPAEITRLTETFLHNPKRVEVARQATAAETIEQGVIRHKPARKDRSEGDKREILRRLLRSEGDSLTNAIVFCNRKRDVDVVYKSLKKHDFNVGALHGDLDQSVRTRTLDGFRSGDISILVASDVAARGLDIPSVSHVINFDVPIHSEDYVHRIGRTGRAGRKGKAMSICFPHEEKHLAKIEELLGKEVPRLESPLAAEAEPEAAETASEKSSEKSSSKAAATSPEAAERSDARATRRRTRTARGRKKDEAETVEAPADAAAETPVETIEAEAAAPEAPAEEAPKERRRAPRRRKAASEDPRDAAPVEDPRDSAPVAREEREERPARREREDRNERGSNDRNADRGNNDRNADRGGRRRGGPVVGMGDHVPAFMLREVNLERILGRGPTKAEDADEADEDRRSEAA